MQLFLIKQDITKLLTSAYNVSHRNKFRAESYYPIYQKEFEIKENIDFFKTDPVCFQAVLDNWTSVLDNAALTMHPLAKQLKNIYIRGHGHGHRNRTFSMCSSSASGANNLKECKANELPYELLDLFKSREQIVVNKRTPDCFNVYEIGNASNFGERAENQKSLL